MTQPRSWRTAFLHVLITMGIIFGSIFYGDISSYALVSGWSITSPTYSGATTTWTFTSVAGTSIGSTEGVFSVIYCSNYTSTTGNGHWLQSTFWWGNSSTTTALTHSDSGTCGGGVTPTGIAMVRAPSSNNSDITGPIDLTFSLDGSAPDPSGPPPVAWCATSDYADPSASYVGTTLSIRFRWLNPVLPATGWSVIAPDPGTSTGSTGTLLKSSTVDGWPGYYYQQFSLSTLSTLTARIYAATDSTSHPGCFVSVTVATNQISNTPNPGAGDTGNDGATSTNTNCGFTLNMFRILKCLFEPSSSLQQWNDLETTAKTRPPISIIYSGIPYVHDIFDFATGNTASCSTPGKTCAQPFDDPSVTGAINSGGTSHQLDLLAPAGNFMQTSSWGIAIYDMLTAGIWVFGLFLVWGRISASFGSKE